MKIWELLNMKYILYAGTLGVVLFLQYKMLVNDVIESSLLVWPRLN